MILLLLFQCCTNTLINWHFIFFLCMSFSCDMSTVFIRIYGYGYGYGWHLSHHMSTGWGRSSRDHHPSPFYIGAETATQLCCLQSTELHMSNIQTNRTSTVVIHTDAAFQFSHNRQCDTPIATRLWEDRRRIN